MKTLLPYFILAGTMSHAAPAPKPPPEVARPLPLTAVRLTGGPLKQAQDLDAKYLLALETGRMMAGYRLRAGLEPKAKGYGGWDSVEGKQLTGHIAGHYLSAVSLMFAATGDVRFKQRADDLVAQLKEVQDRRGTGYLGALTDAQGRDAADIFEQDIATGKIRSGGFDLNGMWAPWYTLHKTFAGLRDAYRHCGNATALELEVKFAQWAEHVLAKLDPAQLQSMLNCEFGGTNEVMVDLYVDTGDQRWLALSRKFEHQLVLDGLKQRQDILPGKHGNTQIPKLIGSMDRYAATGDPADLTAAAFFWERVAHHHSYATGGHGKDEYFGEPDRFNDRIDGRTAESCNVYNMLKLTRRLFCYEPSAAYADFQERALFNHVLGSIDPSNGSTCYMVPVGRGVDREYSDMLGSFTCCVGSGMESHALHGDGIYHESGDKVWINIYAPSTAAWKAGGVELEMATDFPLGETATLRLKLAAPKAFTLVLRKPWWVGDGFAVTINGAAANGTPQASTSRETAKAGVLVEFQRTWKDGDAVEIRLPKTLHLEPLPDNPDRVAILWGPLVLAGKTGEDAGHRNAPGSHVENLQAIPVFVAAGRPPAEWLKPVEGRPGVFRSVGVGRDREVELLPFYQLQRQHYAAYWDLFTPASWEARSNEIALQRERQLKLEAATVAFVQPGEMQPERDFHQQGEDTAPDRVKGRACRRGSKWFSFDVPVDATRPMSLVLTYIRDEWRRRTFDILIDGVRIAEQVIEQRGPQQFFDVVYPLPPAAVTGKTKVTVRFEATGGNEIAAVFGLRMIRAEGQPAIQPISPPEQEFFAKQLDYHGIPIKAHAVVSDAALREAYQRLDLLLQQQPVVLANLVKAGAELHIIGKDQVTSDLPEHRHMKGKPIDSYGGKTVDERTRGLGGLLTSCGEENLLRLDKDHYRGRDICLHEFAHNVRNAGMTPAVRKQFDEQRERSLKNQLWVGSYAGSNPDEFFAELTMWYFGTFGDMGMAGPKPGNGKEGLRKYDPEAFALLDDFYSGKIKVEAVEPRVNRGRRR
ncbi:MAG: glycoside hydrolase family 127 protein [Verrucomicrobia bacterium]|nr:glycoside hydrolase family 127 protein [Verrucomicrobiota bacterium]